MRFFVFRLQVSHLLRTDFPFSSARLRKSHARQASSAFARRYVRNLGRFLFLEVLRCFTSLGSPRMTILFTMRYLTLHQVGCPIRIPAYHRLLQLRAAFRSWSRPSSAPCAKAFTLCSFSLELPSSPLSSLGFLSSLLNCVRNQFVLVFFKFAF